ncbi:hypothetical protein AYI70_g2966 [Smittium culicis]|uniref:Uncharacterized protein n=2 Tax=Smittium culicis TaxID=133412 RepID=A0A1R1Y5S4_9FUNG|nr:hypothetical protein AYI70_g2966 [Smittium culicis]
MSINPEDDEFRRSPLTSSRNVNNEPKKLFDHVEGQMKLLSDIKDNSLKSPSSRSRGSNRRDRSNNPAKYETSRSNNSSSRYNNNTRIDSSRNADNSNSKTSKHRSRLDASIYSNKSSSDYSTIDRAEIRPFESFSRSGQALLATRSPVNKSMTHDSTQSRSKSQNLQSFTTNTTSESRERLPSSSNRAKTIDLNAGINTMKRCFTLIKPDGGLMTDKLIAFSNEYTNCHLVVSNLGRSSVGKSLILNLMIDANCIKDQKANDKNSISHTKTENKSNSINSTLETSTIVLDQPVFKINSSNGTSSNAVGIFIDPVSGLIYLDFPPILSDQNKSPTSALNSNLHSKNSLNKSYNKNKSNKSSIDSKSNKSTKNIFDKFDLQSTISNFMWSDLITVVVSYDPSNPLEVDYEVLNLLIAAKKHFFEIAKNSRLNSYISLPKLIVLFNDSNLTYAQQPNTTKSSEPKEGISKNKDKHDRARNDSSSEDSSNLKRSADIFNSSPLFKNIFLNFSIDAKVPAIVSELRKAGFVVEGYFFIPNFFSKYQADTETLTKNESPSPVRYPKPSLSASPPSDNTGFIAPKSMNVGISSNAHMQNMDLNFHSNLSSFWLNLSSNIDTFNQSDSIDERIVYTTRMRSKLIDSWSSISGNNVSDTKPARTSSCDRSGAFAGSKLSLYDFKESIYQLRVFINSSKKKSKSVLSDYFDANGSGNDGSGDAKLETLGALDKPTAEHSLQPSAFYNGGASVKNGPHFDGKNSAAISGNDDSLGSDTESSGAHEVYELSLSGWIDLVTSTWDSVKTYINNI